MTNGDQQPTNTTVENDSSIYPRHRSWPIQYHQKHDCKSRSKLKPKTNTKAYHPNNNVNHFQTQHLNLDRNEIKPKPKPMILTSFRFVLKIRSFSSSFQTFPYQFVPSQELNLSQILENKQIFEVWIPPKRTQKQTNFEKETKTWFSIHSQNSNFDIESKTWLSSKVEVEVRSWMLKSR